MKLTDDNSDAMDCRPPTGKLMMEHPDYMKERLAKVAADRATGIRVADSGAEKK